MLSTRKNRNKVLLIDNTFDWLKLPVGLTQIFSYPLLVFIRFVIVRKNLKRSSLLQSRIKKEARYVIYSNHQSKLDPFIICASLPLKFIVKLLPFRFFVKNSFFANRGLNFFLNIFGGFPTYFVQNRSFGLEKALTLLKTKQTVVIFPQGGITKEKIAKRGIAFLALQPDVYLIPAFVDWRGNFSCKVTIGSPFQCRSEQTPEALMERVYQLEQTKSF